VPKATTVRLQAELLAGLALLQRILKKPMNRMINEAVRSYVERQSSEVEADLQQVLERVKAYRRSDPGYKRLWAEFVDAEARHGKDDPIEGRIKSAGPVQSKVRGHSEPLTSGRWLTGTPTAPSSVAISPRSPEPSARAPSAATSPRSISCARGTVKR
jgi:hypothetical protein